MEGKVYYHSRLNLPLFDRFPISNSPERLTWESRRRDVIFLALLQGLDSRPGKRHLRMSGSEFIVSLSTLSSMLEKDGPGVRR